MPTEPTRPPERSPDEVRRGRLLRLPFLVLGLVVFVAALYGGLWRLGWALPHGARLGAAHGALMVGGFFGAVIGLERAMALKQRWTLLSPGLAALASLALLGGAPAPFVASLYAVAAGLLAAASMSALLRAPQLFTAVLATGALCWGVGDVVWMRSDEAPFAAPWWMLFLALTVAGERVKAGGPVRRGGVAALLAFVALTLFGASLGLFDAFGARFFGAGLAGLALWLLRQDKSLREVDEPARRFFALGMSAAYAWLGIAGAALVVAPPGAAPYGYDLATHAVTIGLVLSMALAHAVTIVPAITGGPAPYHPALYLGLGGLQASLALRAVADWQSWEEGRKLSGPLTVLALVVYVVVLTWRIRSVGLQADDSDRRQPGG